MVRNKHYKTNNKKYWHSFFQEEWFESINVPRIGDEWTIEFIFDVDLANCYYKLRF